MDILVKLKMKPIYKSSLSLIGFLLVVVLSLGLLYIIFYDKMHKQSDVDVNGYLSINYDDGKSFNIEKDQTFSFTIVNGSEDTSYYNINLKDLNNSGDYILYDNKNKKITSESFNGGNKTILSDVSINGNDSKTYKLKITKKGKNGTLRGSINVEAVKSVVVSFADAIKKNNKPVDVSLTKPGTDIATTDEGLIKSEDDYGIAYYFRGNVLDNYVSFAGLSWRIIKINGDNTVKLVLDGATDNVSSMYTAGTTEFSYESSKIQDYLKNWVQDNLLNYESYLSNNKFCNDITRDFSNVYQSYTRLYINQLPTFNCIGKSIGNNIGILSADEVMMAGGKINVANNLYYLYNPSITAEYFTMTGAQGDANSIKMYMVNQNGSLTDYTDGSLYRGVRPVINIIKNVEVTGNGTYLEPYKLIEKQ